MNLKLPLRKPVAIAIVAHPDDIEFYMAGTLVLLKQAGYETHYMTVASGSCGSLQHDGPTTRRIRHRESQDAARILGAHYHPSLTDDLEILYELKTLRRLAAVIRAVRPTIVFTHSPHDYMEDHTNTCRLVVTAAFSRGMPNFKVVPAKRPMEIDVTIYHAMPHGLRDPLRRRVNAGLFVSTASAHGLKREALSAHRSQKAWLDVSQGLSSYLKVMDEISLAVGRMSRRFQHAEGWRRHLHLGFCAPEADPLCEALGSNCRLNKVYERQLESGID